MRCKGTVVVLHKVFSWWKFAGVLRFLVFSRWELDLLGECWSVFSQEDLGVLTLVKVLPLYLLTLMSPLERAGAGLDPQQQKIRVYPALSPWQRPA